MATKYNADKFRKTFGPRVVLEGDGVTSAEMKERSRNPTPNHEIVDLTEALKCHSQRVFDSDKRILDKLLAG